MKIREFNIFAILIILTPLFPKLKLGNDFYIYLSEICLIPLFVYALCHPRRFFFSDLAQTALLIYWVVILISTIISNTYIFDIGGLLRVFKGFLYLPLIYVGQCIVDSDKYVKRTVQMGVLAIFCSAIFYLIGVMNGGLSIWNEQLINSGFSNKYFDIVKMEFGRIQSGSHGIWGEYSVLIFGLLWTAYRKKLVNTFFFIIGVMIILGSLMSSVSRSASIVFAFTMISIFISRTSSRTFVIEKKKAFFIGLLTLSLLGAFSFFAKSLPILMKYVYTFESIGNSGTELNLEQRINVWYLTGTSFMKEPTDLIWGYGFNRKRYNAELTFTKESINKNIVNPDVPESLLIQSIAYGGFFGISAILVFLFRAIQIFYRSNKEFNLLYFFFGFVVVNVLSGASMLADLLYGQLLLLIGVLTNAIHETHNKITYTTKNYQ